MKMLVPVQLQSNHDNLVNANRTTGVDKIVGTSREVRIERKDGRVVWGGLSLSKLRVGDDIMYTAFVKDVTAEVARPVLDEQPHLDDHVGIGRPTLRGSEVVEDVADGSVLELAAGLGDEALCFI